MVAIDGVHQWGKGEGRNSGIEGMTNGRGTSGSSRRGRLHGSCCGRGSTCASGVRRCCVGPGRRARR
jgi:hypothetical protein